MALSSSVYTLLTNALRSSRRSKLRLVHSVWTGDGFGPLDELIVRPKSCQPKQSWFPYTRSSNSALPERVSAMTDCTLRSGWCSLHCSSRHSASSCFVGYGGFGG